MKLSLPRRLWYENDSLEIGLPDDWRVEVCPMAGAQRPALNQAEIEAALAAPLGSPRLRELAQGKGSAVVVFDDMTRPTRVAQFAPFLLAEMAAAGITEEAVTFLCALGTHGALSMHELRKKLGREVVERFRVFNHNCYENCDLVGTTSLGTEVRLNRELLAPELKVAVSCVTAHPYAGFSGCGKILMPGLAHIDTIADHHTRVMALKPERVGLGKFAGNLVRQDIDEAADLAGLDFSVNVLVNQRGEAAAVVAGELGRSHARAVDLAGEWYATNPRPRDLDVVISNAFVKANEMPIAVALARGCLKPQGGTVVVIADSPEGQVVHYLLGRFGRAHGGRMHPVRQLPDNLRLIILAPSFDRGFGDWFANPEVITFSKTWEHTLELLRENHGPGTRAAVLPNATMQYFAD
jgi:nickel-dependent lactate racemase